MTNIISSRTVQMVRLDRALEYAVIQSWDDLMPESTSGLIHLEYQTGADGSLDFLTILASTIRGHWSLICELWIRPLWSHATGLSFSNGYHSEAFACTLKSVIEHESSFTKLPNPHGLIQIYPPTPEKRSEAKSWRAAAFDDQVSSPKKMDVAA